MQLISIEFNNKLSDWNGTCLNRIHQKYLVYKLGFRDFIFYQRFDNHKNVQQLLITANKSFPNPKKCVHFLQKELSDSKLNI